MRSVISSKLIFASFVGHFDRAYYVRVLCDLIKGVSPYCGEQNLTAVELSECTNTKYQVCRYEYVGDLIYIGLTYYYQQQNEEGE